MLGEVASSQLITTAGAQVGDALLLVKPAPIEGGALVALERGAMLLARGYEPAVIERARNFLRDPGISVLAAARRARKLAPIHSMHDPTEGGVVTGLLEIGRAARVGLRVDLDAVPLLPESVALCREFDLDPLGTIASGSILMTAASRYADRLLSGLSEAGYPSAVIGEVTPEEAGLVAHRSGRAAIWPTFAVDEITKLFR
jgi:hydrogenase maturation factor